MATIRRWSREAFRVMHILNNYIFKKPIIFRRRPVTGGKIIAFLGPDGAGKSTVIRRVSDCLKSYMDIKVEYLGSGDGKSSFFRKPFKIIYSICIKKGLLNPKGKIISEKNETNGYRGESQIGGLIRSVGLIPWIITLSFERRQKLKRVRKFRNKGFVVITDRYPQTQFTGICDGPRFNPNEVGLSYMKRLLSKLEDRAFVIANISRPDIVIILKVSPEVAATRKPNEVDLDTNSKLMNTLLNIDFGKQTQRLVIDANQPLDEVIKAVMVNLWGYF